MEKRQDANIKAVLISKKKSKVTKDDKDKNVVKKMMQSIVLKHIRMKMVESNQRERQELIPPI
eukprot:14905915-Ditylum_brightwellii.AAC.1